jgi:TPR repeat protein
VGKALISAAIDCRRAGYQHALEAGVLAVLAQDYQPRQWRSRPDRPSSEAGLRWATEPVLGANSCLQPDADGRYIAFDYLVDRTQAGGGPLGHVAVQDNVWATVLSLVSPGDAYAVGMMAQQAGRADIAAGAWEIAAKAHDANAAFRLGLHAEEVGDDDMALHWLRRAAGAGHAEAALAAGQLNTRLGAAPIALSWYKRSAELGCAEAMNILATQAMDDSDSAAAQVWLEQAGPCASLDLVGKLAATLISEDNTEDAIRWLTHAANRGDVGAAKSLAPIYEGRGELLPALRWYVSVARTGDVSAGISAGALLEKRGALLDAKKWYQWAARNGTSSANDIPGVPKLKRKELGSRVHAAERGDVRAITIVAQYCDDWVERNSGVVGSGYIANKMYHDVEMEQRSEALGWWRRAAEVNDAAGMSGLGRDLIRWGDPGRRKDLAAARGGGWRRRCHACARLRKKTTGCARTGA